MKIFLQKILRKWLNKFYKKLGPHIDIPYRIDCIRGRDEVMNIVALYFYYTDKKGSILAQGSHL